MVTVFPLENLFLVTAEKARIYRMMSYQKLGLIYLPALAQ